MAFDRNTTDSEYVQNKIRAFGIFDSENQISNVIIILPCVLTKVHKISKF
jgi:hypothetical protein